jgi:hypothetical protein
MGAGDSKELTTCQVDKKSLEKDLERAKDEYEEKQSKVVDNASKNIEKITVEKEEQKREAITHAEKQFNLNLNQQKKFYEEKLLSIRKQLEQAEKLSSVANTSLEEKYGKERNMRQKLSDEMFMVRQKLKNLDVFMQQQVRGAYRTLDTNYGKQQVYDRFQQQQQQRSYQQPTGYQQQPAGYQQQPTGYQQQPAGYQQPSYQQSSYQQPAYTPNPYQPQQPVYQQPAATTQPYSYYR